jgi:hypothetical protein
MSSQKMRCNKTLPVGTTPALVPSTHAVDFKDLYADKAFINKDNKLKRTREMNLPIAEDFLCGYLCNCCKKPKRLLKSRHGTYFRHVPSLFRVAGHVFPSKTCINRFVEDAPLEDAKAVVAALDPAYKLDEDTRAVRDKKRPVNVGNRVAKREVFEITT